MTQTDKRNRPTPARMATRRVLPLAAAALAATGSLAMATNANAATTSDPVRVAAGDDTYGSSARPTYTFGDSKSIVAGVKGNDRMTGYLRFRVGSLPAGTSVAKAQLKLTRDTSTPLPRSVRVHKTGTTAWTEGGLNHKNAPSVEAEIASVSPAATAANVTFEVTSVVKGAGTYTFAVTSTQADAIARFRSAESGGAGPQLTLTLRSDSAKPPSPRPGTPSPGTPSPDTGECAVGAKLVPTCNVLWGAAAGGFSDTPRDKALRDWEAKSGRTASIYHTYHKGDNLFPTKDEIAMAREPGKPRILFTNWKVGYGAKWSDVAAGKQDARIDKLSAFIKANYTDKFFMAIHHEPENDVSTKAGSGMTAKDYAAMYRHTVQRMKANGVNNVVFVMAYMNVEKWNNSSWWYDLYPGDDVVDWLGVDSYVNSQPGGFHYGDFTYLMDRTTDRAKFPGWYTWATTKHPGKPIMVSEWGVYDCKNGCSPAEKAKLFDTVLPQLKKMPAIKAMVYFDTAHDQQGLDMRIDSTPQALTAFKKVAADPIFKVKL